MYNYNRTIVCGCELKIDYPDTDEEIEQMDPDNPYSITLLPCSPVCEFYPQIIDIVNKYLDEFITELKSDNN